MYSNFGLPKTSEAEMKTFWIALVAVLIAGCVGHNPYYSSPRHQTQRAVNDETHFHRRIVDEQSRHQVEQHRIGVQREQDISKTRMRLRFLPHYEVELEVSRLQAHYLQKMENERIAHERNMNNILADRDQQRSRRAIDGIFSIPRR